MGCGPKDVHKPCECRNAKMITGFRYLKICINAKSQDLMIQNCTIIFKRSHWVSFRWMKVASLLM